MAEVTIPKEKMNYTIDLLITMVTDEIAEETGKDRKEILAVCRVSHAVTKKIAAVRGKMLSPVMLMLVRIANKTKGRFL